ncbi:tyrosine-type recombinase/integrase [Selenomonas ruminantium]|uniref:Phage integrase family protein n=1 Tax=Selenomonas ruminantium TaxID=971 RepID=A0A1I0YUH8_SELRU|nr:tyrosine-type recombinase/integrase [Selenomonas ruminantium]SFB16637.1 Phage integrase family protein [Selenomonas ruminantium]
MSTHTADRFDFDLSANKEHFIEKAVSKLSDSVNEVGISRYEAKQELYAKGITDSHSVNQNIGLTSYASVTKFDTNAKTFISYCFDNYGLKNLNQIKPQMCGAFLSEAVDRGYAKNTCQSFASSLEKLAVAMDKVVPQQGHCRAEEWHSVIKESRVTINADALEKDTEVRAYENPAEIISHLSPEMAVVATMQVNHGLRIADATKLTDIQGNTLTVHNSKNGQDLKIQLSDKEVAQIKAATNGSMELSVKQTAYTNALQTACKAAGEAWNGSHGLRHNFAQNRMAELVGGGMDYHKALCVVSHEMGHHRPEVVKIYLR